MFSVEQTVVHHFKGSARLDESLIPAKRIVFWLRGRAVPRSLLRIDESDAGKRPAAGQVMLILFCPEIDVVDGFEPALIVKRGGEFGKPGAHAVGDGVECPDANLGVAGDAILPAVLFFEADAEETDDGLIAHGGAILLGGFADEPGRGETVACLTIGGEHRCATADLD